eukprot:6881058-Pyramimonas_sp.AAC.1
MKFGGLAGIINDFPGEGDVMMTAMTVMMILGARRSRGSRLQLARAKEVLGAPGQETSLAHGLEPLAHAGSAPFAA